MPRPRTTSGSAPPRTDRVRLQILVFLSVVYAIAITIAFALPHAGAAPVITIAVPLFAVALTIAFVVPRGHRLTVWKGAGFRLRGGRGLLVAVLAPVTIIGLSFAAAAALGVVRFPGLTSGLGIAVLSLAMNAVVSTVVLLGEEIGWRGYLFFRLAEVTSGRRAALLSGAFQAIFHLPLLLLTTTYQSVGNRWIVVPMVMVTLTTGGVWYAWLRMRSGSIWPVSLSHSTFDTVAEGIAGAAIATSPVTMAYVTTETGVVTMVIVASVAGFLLIRKAADFDLARPRSPLTPADPPASFLMK